MPDTSSNTLDALIIGAGFAGIGMAIKLKQQGRMSFEVVDKQDEVGGTWQVNTYPGCACDVQSHLYSYSFEPNPNWSRMFSPQPEILNYLRHCADKYGLRPHLRLGTEMLQARFDETDGRWHASLSDGREISARFLIAGIGGLSVPSVPEFPGADSFRGPRFHSQQWDHDAEIDGKTVAVIGTGASAIQFVPELQKRAARVKLFQRTPAWVMPKPDRRIGPRERRLFARFPWLQRAYRRMIYWHLESRVFAFVIWPWLMKLAEQVARFQIRRHIHDPDLRHRLTPSWTMGCKRVLISNDYYPALAQDNVEVITRGITAINDAGLQTADGGHHGADVIVYGTGFKATEPLERGRLIGRGGVDIVDAWADGVQAYKGTAVHGFPNLFMLNGPNTGLGHSSVVFTIETQLAYVLDAMRRMEKAGWRQVEVRAEAQQRYNKWLMRQINGTIWQRGGCRSWYQDESGRNVALWPGFTFGFRWRLRRFDTQAYDAA